MSTATLPEGPKPATEATRHVLPVSVKPALLTRIRRRLELFWRTRIVDGILMRKQIEKLYLVMGGHIYFQTLSTAVRFDLFRLLKRFGGLTCNEVAHHLEIEEQPARILLLGCTTLGLLRKTGTRYANSRLADRLLVSDVPGNLVPIILWQHHINYRPMFRFHEAVEANKNVGLELFDGDEATLYERLRHEPELERIFQNAMEAISVHANKQLAQFVDFSAVRHIVDIGGGNGTNIIQLAKQYPHLRATVFDAPTVCKIASDNISSHQMGDRLDAVPGNCFEDEFPGDADCLLFCHFFTIWSEHENRLLLKKCHESLPSGGKVMIFNMMQRNDEKGPLSAALGSPYFLTLATGRGMLYTWNEYESWMRQAGFENVTQIKLLRDHGVIIGTK